LGQSAWHAWNIGRFLKAMGQSLRGGLPSIASSLASWNASPQQRALHGCAVLGIGRELT